MRIDRDSDGYQPPRVGLYLLQLLVLFLFVFLTIGFWHRQVLNGEMYLNRANTNRLKQEKISANRGQIFDVNRVLLAENRVSYSLAVTPEDSGDIDSLFIQIAQWSKTPVETIRSTYEKGFKAEGGKSFLPVTILYDLNLDDVSKIEAQLINWNGVKIESGQRRWYPHGELFTHIIGYVAKVNQGERDTDKALALNDLIGKHGIELRLEKRLRGVKGLLEIEVDANQRQLQRTIIEEPQAGEEMHIAMDYELQKAALSALGEHSGSVTIMEADTGKLRAVVIAPSYDANILTPPANSKLWASIRDDPRKPMYNRATQSVYPPGSVWKLGMASLLLAEGISPKETVYCPGFTKLGNRIFRCWRKGGHGTVDMTKSLVESCDVYYYLMADRIGIDKISQYMKSYGFGSKTGIDLPGESSGTVPSKEWKRAMFKEDKTWHAGETLNVSIGQGYTLVTPIQMACYVSSLLNGGKLMKPLLLETDEPVVRSIIQAKETDRQFIVEAMRKTVEDPRGTAKRILRKGEALGGKTGTAQVVAIGENRLKSHQMRYEHRDHAWMVSWANVAGINYVMVVMVEHGGGGSSMAGPVSKAVYDFMFDKWNKDVSTDIAVVKDDGSSKDSNSIKENSTSTQPDEVIDYEDVIEASKAWGV